MPRKNLHIFFVFYSILCFISILVSNDVYLDSSSHDIYLYLP